MASRMAPWPVFGVGEDVAFDEQPVRFLDAFLVDVPGRQMAGHGQAGAHGALGVRRDDGDAGAGRFADDDRVAEVDAEFLEIRWRRTGRSGRRRRSR